MDGQRSNSRGYNTRSTAASAARRHSIFVALMKGLLPGLAICLALVGILYAQGLFDETTGTTPFDAPPIDFSGSGVKMINPQLTGLDREGQQFELTAQSAIQDVDDAGVVTMEQIRGRIGLKDGGWLQLEAKGGTYSSDKNILSLEDDVKVSVSTGYVAKLNGARVDLSEGRVNTNNPVLVFMNAGMITGNSMIMYDKGKRVIFKNGTTMTINGAVSHSEPKQ